MKSVRALFIVWLILSGVIYVLHGSKAAAAMFIVAAFYCVLALIIVFVDMLIQNGVDALVGL